MVAIKWQAMCKHETLLNRHVMISDVPLKLPSCTWLRYYGLSLVHREGSVLVSADLIFQHDLTDFQVSYAAWLLSDVIDGVTVTTDDVTLTVSGDNRVQAVVNTSTSGEFPIITIVLEPGSVSVLL